MKNVSHACLHLKVDGLDNDCDDIINEGCTSCVPEIERCEDGIDYDCDFNINEDCGGVSTFLKVFSLILYLVIWSF